MPIRDLLKELGLVGGIAAVNPVVSLDPYYGVFDSTQEAFDLVPASLRAVGKPLAIYKDSTKKTTLKYEWGKNNAGDWVLISSNSETGTYISDIGDISITQDVVTIKTPISGTIQIYFDWVLYTRNEWIDLPFTPVSEGKIKVLVVYALPGSQLLYLAEGVEGFEATEPILPTGALFVRRGIVTYSGVQFDPETELQEYKRKEEDNWKRVPFTQGTTFGLEVSAADNKLNSYLYRTASSGSVTKINTVKVPRAGVRDYEIKVFNSDSADIILEAGTNSGLLIKGLSAINTPFTLKPKRTAVLKFDAVTDKFDIIVTADESKNITNSSNTTTGSHTQTQRVGDSATWETNGQPYSVKGLPDNRADAAFSRLIGCNTNGQFGEVGYAAFMRAATNWTQQQYLNFGQLLNGGSGSDGAISVNLISPPVIQKIDSIEYILLRGTNLALSATSKKIEIINSTTKFVVATIPDNQIQLSTDGLTLIFYYNFKDFAFGNYLIRLTSGVKVYETTLELKVVQNVNNINVDALTWNILYDSAITPAAGDSAVGRNVQITSPNSAGALTKVSVKSAEIFAQGADFYMELKVNLGSKAGADTNKTFIGLGYSATPNALTPNPLIHSNYEWTTGTGVRVYNNSLTTPALAVNSPLEYTAIFIKTGNLFRTIIGTTNQSITLSNNSGYSAFLSIVGRPAIQVIQAQITKAYTFN